MTARKMKISGQGWSLATGINLAQLITVIIAATTFYNQVNNNQAKNEDRFAQYAEQRKTQNDQMMKLQEAQTMMMLQVTTVSGDVKNLAKGVDEIRDALRKPTK